MYDVIIVGAGPAGAAAAYDLAAAGRRVLLLDHRQFPRVKPCAGGLTVKTLRRLRYSVAPVVRQVCTAVAVRRNGRVRTLRSRRPLCVLTVRAELDDFCLRRTIERGAEFRVIDRVVALREDTSGVELETGQGVLRARYLVGADGANSTVRRLLPGLLPRESGLAPLRRGFALEARAAGPLPEGIVFDPGAVPGGYGWLFPKGDHVNLGLYTGDPAVRITRRELGDYAAAVGASGLEQVVGHHLGLPAAGGDRGARGAGVRGARSDRGDRATARVALAGDAAALADPLLGEGIHNAVASGQAAAGAIEAALRGGPDLRAGYARALRPLLRDLRACRRDADWFYAHLDLGFRLLTSAPVGRALVKGCARGLSTPGTRRWLPLLPFLPVGAGRARPGWPGPEHTGEPPGLCGGRSDPVAVAEADEGRGGRPAPDPVAATNGERDPGARRASTSHTP